MRSPEAKDQMTYRGFLADLMTAEHDDRARSRPNGGSPAPAPTPTASPALLALISFGLLLIPC
ncbi:hypothetical protein AB0G68_31800 [Streptomyces eurythermus]|uniref:hypothetical protein n=1 Tax=Streptomyces sp. DSM 40868 TaxID=2721173 RepID=UPI000AA0F3D1|nr:MULTISPECIES: hypothetical protein [Streptomyces]